MHEQSRKLTILFTRITAAARIVRLVGVALIQNGLFVNNTVLRQEIFLPLTLFCKRAITTGKKVVKVSFKGLNPIQVSHTINMNNCQNNNKPY